MHICKQPAIISKDGLDIYGTGIHLDKAYAKDGQCYGLGSIGGVQN